MEYKDWLIISGFIANGLWTFYTFYTNKRQTDQSNYLSTQLSYDTLHLTDRATFQKELRDEIKALKEDRDKEREKRRALQEQVAELIKSQKLSFEQEKKISGENLKLEQKVKDLATQLREAITFYEKTLLEKDKKIQELQSEYERQQEEIDRLNRIVKMRAGDAFE